MTTQIASAPGAPTNLRCEYLTEPLAVAAASPRLYWIPAGESQSAYQIQVAGTLEGLLGGEADLWDSGRVESQESIHIEYEGKPLLSRQVCWWRVRTWDAAGRESGWSAAARWVMGLLHPGDWKGRWVIEPTPVPKYEPPRNGFHTRLVESPDTTQEVIVALARAERVDGVRLFPARPFDWQDTPGFLYPVRFRIMVSDEDEFQRSLTVLDETGSDIPNPGDQAQTYRFPAVSCRYVKLEVTRLAGRSPNEYGFALAELQVLNGETVVSQGAQVRSSESLENAHWRREFLVDGVLHSHGPLGTEPMPAPMFRRQVSLVSAPVRAMAYVSALGIYELFVNGKRVGEQVLAPEWTDYEQRVQYQAYDVTELLHAGENAIGAVVGDGWYAGRLGLAGVVPDGPPRRIYGPTPALYVQIEMEYDDGKRDTLVTDESWRSTREGPWRVTDLLDGVTYDARREMPGWTEPGFDDSGWSPVALARPDIRMTPQPNEPIRVAQELEPQSVTRLGPDSFLVDFGQNQTGWCRLTASAPAGTQVTLRHGEMKDESGGLYTTNLRSAAQTDVYIFRGEGREAFEPRFTYHGFRYVEVSGLPEPPEITACVVHSNPPETLDFSCSDPQLNRLMQNVLWTQRSNMYSVPTDCPQRDERLGWMGDILAFAETAMFNMDMAAFFTKWLRDVREAQAQDGRFGDVSPHPYDPDARFSGAPAWADAGVFVPWSAYVRYGDKRLLAEQYDAAKKWVEFVHSKNPDGIWRNVRGNDYGDWLNSDTLVLPDMPKVTGEMPKEAFATAFLAQSTRILGKMAGALGKPDEEIRYEAAWRKVRDAFVQHYVQPDGKILGDTQAGYAIALEFDLLPEHLQPKAVEHLLAAIEAYGGHLSTGFHTTRCLMRQLVARGHADVAYKLLDNRTPPSWRYPIEQGATTIWERWDGYVAGRGFQNPGMNSFSHYAFGCIGEWLVEMVAGIRPLEDGDAMRRFEIRPVPGGSLTTATAEYRSIRGPIRVSWSLVNGQFGMRVTVPSGCEATVYVPTTDPGSARLAGHPLSEAAGVEALAPVAGAAVCKVKAGEYTFTATR
ncbi:MAG: hypothetical protein AMXMBFR61_10140 [Fimbriimonadales bacterium]